MRFQVCGRGMPSVVSRREKERSELKQGCQGRMEARLALGEFSKGWLGQGKAAGPRKHSHVHHAPAYFPNMSRDARVVSSKQHGEIEDHHGHISQTRIEAAPLAPPLRNPWSSSHATYANTRALTLAIAHSFSLFEAVPIRQRPAAIGCTFTQSYLNTRNARTPLA